MLFRSKNLTLDELSDYFNDLAADKIPNATTYIFDVDNPNYMDYFNGEVSSGSIDSEEWDGGFTFVGNHIERDNLHKWPIKILDYYT